MVEPTLELHPGIELNKHPHMNLLCVRKPWNHRETSVCGLYIPRLDRVRKKEYPLVITRSNHIAAPNYNICPSCLKGVMEMVLRERDGVENLNNFLVSVFTAFGKEITKGVV